jgi:hypothetical protein
VVRHGLDLRVKYRMVDKTLNPCGPGGGDGRLPDGHFVRADIRADVVDRPNAVRRPQQRPRIPQVANHHFLYTALLNSPLLLWSPYHGSYRMAAPY